MLQGAAQVTLLSRSPSKLEAACKGLSQIIQEKGLSASVQYQAADASDAQQVPSPPPPPPPPGGGTIAGQLLQSRSLSTQIHRQVQRGLHVAQAQKAVAAAEAAQGPIDILVCCAGTSTPGRSTLARHLAAWLAPAYTSDRSHDRTSVGTGRILEQDTAIFEKTMNVNYYGVVHTVKAAVPGMVARREGQVVLIASVMAVIGGQLFKLCRQIATAECECPGRTM